jgi:hypothetical protein
VSVPGRDGADTSALAAIGLTRGERVRFRRGDRARWQLGAVACLERDGSLRVTDGQGAARTVALADVQVRGRRMTQWEALADRSSRAVQMQFDLRDAGRRRRA